MLDFLLVIPARYKSKRLPGKPLINLKGIDDKKYLKKMKSAVKTLIQRAELLHQKVFIKTMKIIDD